MSFRCVLGYLEQVSGLSGPGHLIEKLHKGYSVSVCYEPLVVVCGAWTHIPTLKSHKSVVDS